MQSRYWRFWVFGFLLLLVLLGGASLMVESADAQGKVGALVKFQTSPLDLMLPAARWAALQLGGTWSELFNTQALINRFPLVGAIVWYLALAVLSLVTYPILRLALPGLYDKGYPLARAAGMLILSYIVWLAGSFQVPFTRLTISLAFLMFLVVAGLLAYFQRRELGREWRVNKRYFLMIEGLFLAFFLLDLLIRLGNPDLWHPSRGGEKPMDFSFLNAILKSTSFPPYDPWFAGGYLNYYYYGFVLVGVLIKWLGIQPSIAYNLILPTMFALIALGAFSLAWNVYSGAGGRIKPLWVGLAGALGMAVMGNLGTVKMIYEGFQQLAAPGGEIQSSTLLERLSWAVQGFFRYLSVKSFSYDLSAWYWNPSRIIPARGEVEPITEFPSFTILYADPHAHLYAMSLALLSLSFILSVVLAHGRWKSPLGGVFGFLLGGLAIGALRPTNTWDVYPYLAIGGVALAYTFWRYYTSPDKIQFLGLDLSSGFTALPVNAQRLLASAGGVLLLTLLSLSLYQPYTQWYGLGYTKAVAWQGPLTPLSAYFNHWGLFLFMFVSWFAWETRDWIKHNPSPAMSKLAPHRALIAGLLALLLTLTAALALKLPISDQSLFGNGVVVAWAALPLAAWAGFLLLRPDQPDAKRFALFLIGTGFVLTVMVEMVVLVGDTGRMNTVFKFYLQVWTLFAATAAAATGWLLSSIQEWRPGWRYAWCLVLALLEAGAFLYPVAAGRAKIQDRMTPDAPHTLDGMKFLETTIYRWRGLQDLGADYRAIRWMQENVQGSPVIVEANIRDLYHWGSRFSIYTGLPGVVGWEGHELQQRALVPSNWISDRIAEIDAFYTTTDLETAQKFLQKYGVKYIVVGQLERNHYPAEGLIKFETENGKLWQEVYRDGNTVIYTVTKPR
jgi:YYY domain-containing protein